MLEGEVHDLMLSMGCSQQEIFLRKAPIGDRFGRMARGAAADVWWSERHDAPVSGIVNATGGPLGYEKDAPHSEIEDIRNLVSEWPYA